MLLFNCVCFLYVIDRVMLHGLCSFVRVVVSVCVLLYVCVLFVMYCVMLYGLVCA